MGKKLILKICVFILLLASPTQLLAQNAGLKGRIIDEDTQKPLPFVHVIYTSNNEGITSDMDGDFQIKNIDKIEFLKFSYVGYEPAIFSKANLQGKSYLKVKLSKKTFDIDEVTIFPGENPAHRIIKAVVRNRKENNPEKLASYSYKSYHKMYFTVDLEQVEKEKRNSLNTDSTKVDSGYIRMKKFLAKQHLFMMESVSERKYKRPGKVSEKVIASRVSGFKEPSFVMLATQLQSFSFYNEMISLLDSRYINPISKGSTNRYFFNIEDTTYNERGDTIFSISYRPKKGKNFEALKGVLNINSHGYAIQSVVAEPVEDNGIMNIRIKQNYQHIDGKHWFPNQLNTDIIFSNLASSEKDGDQMPVVGIGKSYIDEVTLNEEYKNSDFSAIEVDVDKAAFKQNDSIWQKYRIDSLSNQEKRTYVVLDSIGEKHKLDLKLKLLKTLTTGYIPIHFINFDPFGLLNFNVYEGYRPGLRVKTNDKLSSLFSVGGFGAYGFKDEKWKYGGSLNFNVAPRQELKLGFDYKNDVEESSGYKFFEEKEGMNSTEYYRYFFIKDMTYNESYSTTLEFRTFKRWKVNFYARQSTRWNTSDYFFSNKNDYDEPSVKYNFQEAGIQLKFAPNESKAFVAGELFSSNPYSSPVLYLNFIKGFKSVNSDFDYSKVEAKLKISFLTKAFGRTNLQLIGGKVIGDLPYFMLYNGHGSYYNNFDVETANSFATMRLNEFLSDEFFSIHFRQDFGSLLFKAEKFRPELVLTTSIGFGQLEKPELHNNLNFRTMENGYYESGLMINYLLKQLKFIGYGIGVFYRYGPYSYSNNSDNFAYKLTLMFKL